MALTPKISLRKKGESAAIPVKNLHVKLQWKTAIDLDLYVIYKTKGNIESSGGFFSKLFGTDIAPNKEGKVFFASKGSLEKFPFIKLDQDAGIGDVAGDNEENLKVKNLDVHSHLLIVANIYNKPNSIFSNYDGRVTIFTDKDTYEVPLTASEKGNWCVIAHLDNSSPVGANLININKIFNSCPKVSDFI